MALRAIPLTIAEANTLIESLHRHHKKVQGHRFSIGAVDTKTGQVVGAVVVGRPVARKTDAKKVAEVTRLVTNGHKNAPSFLYSRAAQAAEAIGFEKIQTFILESEPGTSLRAAGWHCEARSQGGDWNQPSRGGRRIDQPQGPKWRYVRFLRQPQLEQQVAA